MKTIVEEQSSKARWLFIGMVICYFFYAAIYIWSNIKLGTPGQEIMMTVASLIELVFSVYLVKSLKLYKKQFQFDLTTWLEVIVFFGLLLWDLSNNDAFANWASLAHVSSKIRGASILFALGTAINEEVMVRNLLFKGFMITFKNSRHKIVWAALVSSVIFALLHMVNAILGQPLVPTLQETVGAFAIGLEFCALYLISNNLLVPIVVHFLYDLSPISGNGLAQGENSWTAILGEALLVFIVSLFIIILLQRKQWQAVQKD